MKLKSALISGLAAAALMAGQAAAEVKVGMITTLSGGGAGLGIDSRDGFMLAVKLAGNDKLEVVVEDDQRKPDIAVQLADKMIQSDQVDVLTGIVWSNLAMAVVPSCHRAGQVLPFDQCGSVATGRRGLSPELFLGQLSERQPARSSGAPM
jgi:branched-chain amino acid transport system substrate-binding protein